MADFEPAISQNVVSYLKVLDMQLMKSWRKEWNVKTYLIILNWFW